MRAITLTPNSKRILLETTVATDWNVKAALEFGLNSRHSLALRANAEELQLVADRFEAVADGDGFFERVGKTLFNFHDFSATRADEMMMVPVFPLPDQFEAGDAVTEIKPFHHAHALEQVHGAVDCGQVAITFCQRGKNILVGQRMRVLAHDFENRLAWAGHFAGMLAKSAGEFVERLGRVSMGAGKFHRVIQWNITVSVPSPTPHTMATTFVRLNRCPSLLSNRIVVEMCMKMPMTMAVSSRV